MGGRLRKTLFAGTLCPCVEGFFNVRLTEGASRDLLDMLTVLSPAGFDHTVSGPRVHVVFTLPRVAVVVVHWLEVTPLTAADAASSFPFSCALADKLQALASAAILCLFCWSVLLTNDSCPSSVSECTLFL